MALSGGGRMTSPRTLVQRANMDELLQAYVTRWPSLFAYIPEERGHGSVPCPECGPREWGADRGALLCIRDEWDIWCPRCKLSITRCRLEREVVESSRCVAALFALMAVDHE